MSNAEPLEIVQEACLCDMVFKSHMDLNSHMCISHPIKHPVRNMENVMPHGGIPLFDLEVHNNFF